jgi:hypothetical protein
MPVPQGAWSHSGAGLCLAKSIVCFTCVRAHTWVCNVCMYVCMYVHIDVFMYVCMHACTYAYKYKMSLTNTHTHTHCKQTRRPYTGTSAGAVANTFATTRLLSASRPAKHQLIIRQRYLLIHHPFVSKHPSSYTPFTHKHQSPHRAKRMQSRAQSHAQQPRYVTEKETRQPCYNNRICCSCIPPPATHARSRTLTAIGDMSIDNS